MNRQHAGPSPGVYLPWRGAPYFRIWPREGWVGGLSENLTEVPMVPHSEVINTHTHTHRISVCLTMLWCVCVSECVTVSIRVDVYARQNMSV